MRYTGRTQQQHVSNPVWTYAYTGVHWIPALLIWSSGVSPPEKPDGGWVSSVLTKVMTWSPSVQLPKAAQAG